MELVLDIGNSAIKGGIYAGASLDHTFQTSHEASSLGPTLLAEIEGRAVERAGLASVVPDSAHRVERFLEERAIPVTTVRSTMRLPFEMAYRTPETLGADRLAAATAAWLLFGSKERRSVVALDAGTAFTYEVVARPGIYLGGTIAAGPALMQRALNRETAQLPEVPLSLPEDVIGRSTIEAIQAGIMYGFIEGVRGLLRRINATLGEKAFVVATGGWSAFLLEHVEEVAAVHPHLVLEGVRGLMELNR